MFASISGDYNFPGFSVSRVINGSVFTAATIGYFEHRYCLYFCMFVCLYICLPLFLSDCSFPGFSVSQVLSGSFLVAAIGYLEHIAIGQSFAVKSSYQIDNSQVLYTSIYLFYLFFKFLFVIFC